MNTNTPVAPVANTDTNTKQVTPVAKVTPLSDSQVMKEELALAGLGEELGHFKAYDSQLSIATITGTRIIKCLYQASPKTGKKAQENAYVRVPTHHLTEEHILASIAELTPYVLTWLQGLEDIAIKDIHKKGGLSVFPASLSLDKIISALEESSEGARLNKEKIEAWFTDMLEEELTEQFALKMKLNEDSTTEELAKLQLVLDAYKSKFASLAGGKTYIKPEDCTALIGVIAAVPAASTSLLGIRFTTRLGKMSIAKDEVLLSL